MLASPVVADPIIERLNAVVETAPELDEMASLYAAILPLLRPDALHVALPEIDARRARNLLAEGKPLLSDGLLAIDEWDARNLMIELARALERVSQEQEPDPDRTVWLRGDRRALPRGDADEEDMAWERATEARLIRLELEQGKLDARGIMELVAANDRDEVFQVAETHQLDADLLWMLAGYALQPALRAWRQQLVPLLGTFTWNGAACFVCGGPATFAELQGNEAFKHLRCARCGADWSVPRLQCAYCGNEDDNSLTYLIPEQQRDTRWRVQVCDNCHGYMKILTTFAPTAPELIIVEDLAGLYLDLLAASADYIRPTPMA